MLLAAASALSACGIDLQSYGEPLFALAHRDSGVTDAGDDADGGTQSEAGSDQPGGGNAADAGSGEADR